MKKILVFSIAMLAAVSVRAQHSVQLDDGAGHFSLLKSQTGPDAVDIFMLPSGGGTLIVAPPPNTPALVWLTAGNTIGAVPPSLTVSQTLGSLNAFDVIMVANNAEKMRLVSGGGVTVAASLTVNAQSNLQNTLPILDNTYDLGTPVLRWRNMYAAGSLSNAIDNPIAQDSRGIGTNGFNWETNTDGFAAIITNRDNIDPDPDGLQIAIANNTGTARALVVTNGTNFNPTGGAGVRNEAFRVMSNGTTFIGNLPASASTTMVTSNGGTLESRAISSVAVTTATGTAPITVNGDNVAHSGPITIALNQGSLTTSTGAISIGGTGKTVGSNITVDLTTGSLSSGGSLTIGGTGLTVGSGITANINVANPNAWTGTQTLGGEAHTPANSALGGANVNDYALGAANSYYRISSTANINLTGLQNGAAGRTVVLQNVGAFNITLKSQQGSAAGNQFDLPGGNDIILGPKGAISLIYDATAGVISWEVVSTN